MVVISELNFDKTLLTGTARKKHPCVSVKWKSFKNGTIVAVLWRQASAWIKRCAKRPKKAGIEAYNRGGGGYFAMQGDKPCCCFNLQHLAEFQPCAFVFRMYSVLFWSIVGLQTYHLNKISERRQHVFLYSSKANNDQPSIPTKKKIIICLHVL